MYNPIYIRTSSSRDVPGMKWCGITGLLRRESRMALNCGSAARGKNNMRGQPCVVKVSIELFSYDNLRAVYCALGLK